VAVGDFNRDGIKDLAVANFGSNTVSVLLGNGDGTFRLPPTNLAVGNNPFSVAVGDFNGDGRQDLAVANLGSNTVSVLLGNGDGTFGQAQNVAVGNGPAAVAVGDFAGHGNGMQDLAVANFYDTPGTVSVILGTPAGLFLALPPISVGNGPFSLAVGDLDGDTHTDLAVANYSSNSVSVLLGNGNGGFVAQPPIAVLSPFSVAVDYFNGDGHLDLAVVNNGPNTVSVLRGNGDGTFQAPQTLNAGTGPVFVAVGDFNGDRIPDLAVTNYGVNGIGSSISVLLGGSGAFRQPAGTFTLGDGLWGVAVGDFNGDHHPDLVVANRSGTGLPGLTVSVVLGNGDGTFVVTKTVGVGSNPTSVAIGDFDRNGIPDLAVTNAGSNTVSVLLGNPDGTFQAPQTLNVGSSPASVAVGDFNGDGFKDLAVANYGCGGGEYYCTTSSTTVTVMLGNRDGTFQTTGLTSNAGIGPNSVAVGDFNRDGYLDLAVANYGSTPPGGFSGDGSTVSVLLGIGNGTFNAGPTLNVGHGSTFVVASDFNRDGILDLAVANYADATVSVLLGNGDRDGTFHAALGSPYHVAGGPWSIAVSDFNGDGYLDLAVATYGTDLASVSVLLGNGNGTFLPAVSYPAGWGPMGPISVAVGDFAGHGNGIKDLAVANFKSTTVSVLVGNGDGSFQAPQAFDAGITPGFVAVPDLNSNGLQYLIVPNVASNTVSVLLGAGLPSLVTPTPVLNPAGAAFTLSVQVTITDSNGAAAIYYTTDGSTPTTSSTRYTGPITVTRTTTIKAIAQAPGSAPSGVASGTYTILVPPPTFSPPGGPYTTPQSVTLSDTTNPSTIYYTTDGSTPTTASTQYTAPISVTQTTTIRAMATANGMANSDVSSATYTIVVQVPPPTFSPPGGPYTTPQTVTLSDTNTSATTIYYTTDGSTPTTASTPYTTPISVTQTTTIRAMATASGMANSNVASATYTILIPVATPTFSPPGGTYATPQSVTLSDTNTSATTIYYTTDGSTPTTASTQYTTPISVTQNTTIRAMAAASGMANSNVASATYTIRVATPTFSLPGGTYVGPQSVTLSDTTSGATIYYTTDGSTPTTASTPYTAPISVTRSMTVRAMAAASGMADSNVASATYTIRVATPTLSPPGGTYSTPQSVTLSDTTSSAAIYYTTDGSTPTTASTAYTGSISVTRTTTIRAMAAASGMADSSVASATYTLRAATPTFSPPGGTYVLPQFVSISDASPGVTIYYTTDGSTPTTSSAQYGGPILVLVTTTIKAMAVAPGWSQSPVASATYTNVLF